MRIQEQVSLASLTTFKVGGNAQYVLTCESLDDIQTALAFSRERGLPWYVLGGGSNLLVNDGGFAGVIILMRNMALNFSEPDAKGNVSVTVSAGAIWDEFVEACARRGLWGVENLAGIPGSVGAAPVQNIGAYGADVSQTISHVEVLDVSANEIDLYTNAQCKFGYRDSIFKRNPNLIILSVSFALTLNGAPHVEYADLARKKEEGVMLDSPKAIAEVVRDIRAQKFPDLAVTGTAGSFFKNPTITPDAYAELQQKYPEIPGYSTDDGIKISLAWILDKVLSLRGYSLGHVRLFERQPLVLVAESGATANDVDALANEVVEKVFAATNIKIEREVRSL